MFKRSSWQVKRRSSRRLPLCIESLEDRCVPSATAGFGWNLFDQVLLRSELLPLFRNGDLKILTTDGLTGLLNRRGRPDRNTASDHLPLLFRLAI